MNIYHSIINEIKAASKIVITAHKSPDGDSVGSSLGLYHFIKKLGKEVVICHPDPAPDYLLFLENIDEIQTITHHHREIETHFKEADLIFCLDYNATNRVGEIMQVLLEESLAKKIMIDHHLEPESFAFITLSETSACSTCQLITDMIDQSGNSALLDEKIGTPLYLGILTDTGSFRFPSVQPRTHELIALLLKAGVKHYLIHETLNDNNTINRLRLQGYALYEKMEFMEEYKLGIISLTADELERLHYQKGDTEGLVNMILSVKGMRVAMFFSEKDGIVKISFRSKGDDNPVNVFASENFSGGGHANASGGMSELSMEETLLKAKSLIPNYFKKI